MQLLPFKAQKFRFRTVPDEFKFEFDLTLRWMRKKCKICLVGIVLCLWFTGCNENKIDFSAQVKPILNKRCISCHGGVKRNAHFSLLFRQEALDTAESGKLAIIPGDPGHSELVRRINANDPEERMPYKEEPLSKAEIDILDPVDQRRRRVG